MRKFLYSSILLLFVFNANAQTDKLYKHVGEIIEAKIVRISEFVVVYKYADEETENIISKYAIDKIIYGKTGREEKITDKVEVYGEADWEKVVVLDDKSQITGLKRVEEIQGKTSFINMHTASTGDRKAMRKLLEAAAKKNCPFILLTSEKQTNFTGAQGKYWGNLQEQKKAIAYKY